MALEGWWRTQCMAIGHGVSRLRAQCWGSGEERLYPFGACGGMKCVSKSVFT